MQAILDQTSLNGLALGVRLHGLHQVATKLGQLQRNGQAFDFQQILVTLGMSLVDAELCWEQLDHQGWGRPVTPEQATSNTELAISLGILLQSSSHRPRNWLLYWLLQQYLPDKFRVQSLPDNHHHLLFKKSLLNGWGDTLPAYKIYQGQF